MKTPAKELVNPVRQAAQSHAAAARQVSASQPSGAHDDSARLTLQRRQIEASFGPAAGLPDRSGAVIQPKWKELLGLGGVVLGGVGAVAFAPAAIAGAVATGVTAAVLGATGYLIGNRLDEGNPTGQRLPEGGGEGGGSGRSTSATQTEPPVTKDKTDATSGGKQEAQEAPRQPLVLSATRIVQFVDYMAPKKYTSLGLFMIAAKKEFLSESGITEADWNANKAAIQQRADRYFGKEEEALSAPEETKASTSSGPRPYSFNDNSTWTVQPLHSPNGTGWTAVNVGAHDQFYLDALRRGELTNNSVARSPAVGVRYHAHMVNNGGGGIAFYYENTGGSSVRPVIYDWALTRTGNDYHWVRARTTSNTAP